MDERDRFLETQKEEIRRKITEGYESLRRGEGIDGEEAFRILNARHAKYRAQALK